MASSRSRKPWIRARATRALMIMVMSIGRKLMGNLREEKLEGYKSWGLEHVWYDFFIHCAVRSCRTRVVDD